MKSPHRRMRLRRWRFNGSRRPSQLLVPKSCGHVGSWVGVAMREKRVVCDLVWGLEAKKQRNKI